jgi:hypothetical protein
VAGISPRKSYIEQELIITDDEENSFNIS